MLADGPKKTASAVAAYVARLDSSAARKKIKTS
jgi:hypothetical protein